MRGLAHQGRALLLLNHHHRRYARTAMVVPQQPQAPPLKRPPAPGAGRRLGASAEAQQQQTAPSDAPGFATDSKDSPFNELRLPVVMGGMGKVRVRQHVNPLRAEYQQPVGPIDWAAAFEDPTLPLVVDLGCGPGRFLLLLQRRAAAGAVGVGVPAGGRCNFLGVEIRRALVDRANEWARQLGASGSVHYVFANATVSLGAMLEGYPGPVEAFYVQFPDPHFKQRHRKRRLLQPHTVQAIRDALKPGGLVFLQSDILRAAEGLRDAIEEAAGDAFGLAPQHSDPGAVFFSGGMVGGGGEGEGKEADEGVATVAPGLEDIAPCPGSSSDDGDDFTPAFASRWAAGGWLRDNPVGVPTEREYYVEATQGAPVYRVLLVRR